MRASKLTTLAAMAARVPDGASLALGGSFLHRGPFAFVRELIRQGRRGLEIVKQSPGYDLDILCRAGCVAKARAGIVAMEGNFGLAPWYRRAVEKREIVLEEHACMTLTAGLRAAAFGVPFRIPAAESSSWRGLLAPAKTPRPILEKMHEAFAKALRDPKVQPKLEEQGVVLRISSPEEFGAFLRNEVERWAKVVKENHIAVGQ